MCKVRTGKPLCRCLFEMKFWRRYFSLNFTQLNTTPIQRAFAKSCFCCFFLEFHFFLCKMTEDNENQRFSNYENINQFQKNLPKFHGMSRNLFFSIRVFLPGPLTNHRTAGEGGMLFFNSSPPLPMASQTLRHKPSDYCRQLSSTHR